MTTDTPITAAAYADLVRAELTDLPPDDLASMVEGLDAHLAEIAADGQADLVAALGAPAAYAAELRSAAGLPAKARATFMPPAPPVASHLAFSSVFTARAVVGLAVAAAVVAVIAADPTIITTPRSVAVVAGVGVVWWALNWLTARCALTPRRLAVGRAFVAAAALAAAAILGAELHATSNDGAGGGDVFVPITTTRPVDGVTAMPDVVGQTADDAVQQLMSLGLTITVAYQTGGGEPLGTSIVIATDPSAGSLLADGTTVTLIVVNGPSGVFTGTMVQVANCGAQNGVAEMMSSVLSDAGFTMAAPTLGACDPKLTTSYVIYNEGTPAAADVAATLARLLGLHAEPAVLPIKVESGAWAEGSGVVLLLGNDIAGKTLDQIRGTPLGGTLAPSTLPSLTTSTTIAVIQP